MIVAFEGLDGSGKGTQSQILSAKMSAKGIDNSLYSFPNYKGTNFGLEVGKYLNGGFGALDEIPPQFPVMLYAMDRFEMKKSIMTDIAEGLNIIFDRYVPSALAYRMAEGIDKNWINNINSIFPKADIGFFIDITPEESVKRNTDPQFNIKASPEHLAKVRKAYLSIISENNLIYINGMQPIQNIFDEVINNIEEYRRKNEKRI